MKKYYVKFTRVGFATASALPFEVRERVGYLVDEEEKDRLEEILLRAGFDKEPDREGKADFEYGKRVYVLGDYKGAVYIRFIPHRIRKNSAKSRNPRKWYVFALLSYYDGYTYLPEEVEACVGKYVDTNKKRELAYILEKENFLKEGNTFYKKLIIKITGEIGAWYETEEVFVEFIPEKQVPERLEQLYYEEMYHRDVMRQREYDW